MFFKCCCKFKVRLTLSDAQNNYIEKSVAFNNLREIHEMWVSLKNPSGSLYPLSLTISCRSKLYDSDQADTWHKLLENGKEFDFFVSKVQCNAYAISRSDQKILAKNINALEQTLLDNSQGHLLEAYKMSFAQEEKKELKL